jgi:hypothetical protein
VELRHLRYFVAAAETENVSRAALKLRVFSQPRILPAILRAYQRARLPSQLGLQSSALLGQVEELPRKKPRARSGDGIPPEFCDENLIWPD